MAIRSIGVFTLLFFYGVYLGKMLLQKRQGIQTDQIAKNKVKNRTYYIELLLKIATYSVVLVEVISIFAVKRQPPVWAAIAGTTLAIAGDGIFFLAVRTMQDSWRAGLAENDKTELITAGIYQFSRNPAFLGFDLVYLGLLLLFFNWILLVFTLFAAVMLHLQILQEENYLPGVFGKAYLDYQKNVNRYFGRK